MKNIMLLGVYLTISLLQANESDVKKLYKTNCIICHTTKLISRDQKKILSALLSMKSCFILKSTIQTNRKQ
jgi:hypothetical protein